MPGRHEVRLTDPQRPSTDIAKDELVKDRVGDGVTEALVDIVGEAEALLVTEGEGDAGDEAMADPVVASDVLALAVSVGLTEWESEGVAVADGDVELESMGLACCVALGKSVTAMEGIPDSVVTSVETSLLDEVALLEAVALGVGYAEEHDPKRSKHDTNPQWSDVVPQYPYMLQHSGGGHAVPTAGPHCALEVIGIAVGVATGVSVGAEL